MSGAVGPSLSNAIWISAAVAFGNFAFTIVGVYSVDRTG